MPDGVAAPVDGPGGAGGSVGWAIVGPGRQADLAIAPAIKSAPGGWLVAVASRDAARADEFAARHHAVLATTRYEDVLADPRVDAVYVGTPNATHAAFTAAALEAGKHVLSDKPMGISVSEASTLVRLAERRNRKLGVCFQLRHDPAHVEARRLIAAGAIGDVVLIQATGASHGQAVGWRRSRSLAGAGVIFDLGVHVYDLMRFLLGSEIASIGATREHPRRSWADRTVLATLRFRSGALGYAVCDHAGMDLRRDVEVFGTTGTITCSDSTHLSPASQGDTVTPFTVSKGGPGRAAEIGPRNLLFRQIADFNGAVTNDREPNASGRDGIASAAAVEAVLASLDSGQAVRLRADTDLRSKRRSREA